MSLYENINRRRKAGTSRQKAKSTIDPKTYRKMKNKRGDFKPDLNKFSEQYNDYIDTYCSKEHGFAEDVTDELEQHKANKKLNKPFRTPKGPKKFSVYVKNDKGDIVKVNFGDPNMSIKRDDPNARKNFRSRHNCSDPGPKWKARYWSCKFWSKKAVSKMV
jgi:hypothetical protein